MSRTCWCSDPTCRCQLHVQGIDELELEPIREWIERNTEEFANGRHLLRCSEAELDRLVCDLVPALIAEVERLRTGRS